MSRFSIVPGIKLLGFSSVAAALLSVSATPMPVDWLADQIVAAKIKVRPIVALEKPVRDAGSFMGLLLTADASEEAASTFFKRNFAPQQLAQAEASPEANEPAEGRSGQAGDPNFKRWQVEADQRLKEENTIETGPQHPLAVAYPGKAVVVCEAGCRTDKDEVVYVAAIVPAVLPEQKFDPSSSAGTRAKLDEGAAPCIAGCYDRPERPVAAVQRKSELIETPAAKHAYPLTRAEPSTVGVILPPERAAPYGRLSERASRKLQIGHNGAIVDRRGGGMRLKTVAQHATGKMHFRHKEAGPRSWRSKVTYATQRRPQRHSSTTGSMSGTSPWQTEIHIFVD